MDIVFAEQRQKICIPVPRSSRQAQSNTPRYITWTMIKLCVIAVVCSLCVFYLCHQIPITTTNQIFQHHKSLIANEVKLILNKLHFFEQANRTNSLKQKHVQALCEANEMVKILVRIVGITHLEKTGVKVVLLQRCLTQEIKRLNLEHAIEGEGVGKLTSSPVQK
jgi:hypothetical protein